MCPFLSADSLDSQKCSKLASNHPICRNRRHRNCSVQFQCFDTIDRIRITGPSDSSVKPSILFAVNVVGQQWLSRVTFVCVCVTTFDLQCFQCIILHHYSAVLWECSSASDSVIRPLATICLVHNSACHIGYCPIEWWWWGQPDSRCSILLKVVFRKRRILLFCGHRTSYIDTHTQNVNAQERMNKISLLFDGTKLVVPSKCKEAAEEVKTKLEWLGNMEIWFVGRSLLQLVTSTNVVDDNLTDQPSKSCVFVKLWMCSQEKGDKVDKFLNVSQTFHFSPACLSHQSSIHRNSQPLQFTQRGKLMLLLLLLDSVSAFLFGGKISLLLFLLLL